MERLIAAAPRVVLGLLFVAISWSKFHDAKWVRLFQPIGLGQ